LLETYSTLSGEDLAKRLPTFLNIGKHSEDAAAVQA
jgi:hypothetical protein